MMESIFIVRHYTYYDFYIAFSINLSMLHQVVMRNLLVRHKKYVKNIQDEDNLKNENNFFMK